MGICRAGTFPTNIEQHKNSLSNPNKERLYKCPLGNPLRVGSHKFKVKFKIDPTGEVKRERFSWHINNTNDYPVETKVKHSDIEFYINPNHVKIELLNEQTFRNDAVDKLTEQFRFNQR